MSDLRQSLIDVIKPYEGDTVMHGSSAPEMADEALAVFAKWLRARGRQLEPVLHSPSVLLAALADEIDPRAPEGQQG